MNITITKIDLNPRLALEAFKFFEARKEMSVDRPAMEEYKYVNERLERQRHYTLSFPHNLFPKPTAIRDVFRFTFYPDYKEIFDVEHSTSLGISFAANGLPISKLLEFTDKMKELGFQ